MEDAHFEFIERHKISQCLAPSIYGRRSYFLTVKPEDKSGESSMAKFENRLACVIKSDGAIARGYMIDKCEMKG